MVNLTRLDWSTFDSHSQCLDDHHDDDDDHDDDHDDADDDADDDDDLIFGL